MFSDTANKKGNIFTVGTLLFFIIAASYAFITIDAKYDFENNGIDLRIGSYQAGVIDAAARGEKYRVFVQKTAEISGKSSLTTFSSEGGYYLESAGGGEEARLSSSACGTYVYNKWSTREEFCEPPEPKQAYENTFKEQFNALAGQHPDFDSAPYDVVASGNETMIVEGNASPLSLPIYVVRPGEVSINPYEVEAPEFSGEFSWPVDSTKLSSCYGNRELRRLDGQGMRPDFHDGIDVSLKEGEDVRSASSGVVVSKCDAQTCSLTSGSCNVKCGGYGNYVIIKHNQTTYTRYSHLEDVMVNVKEEVDKGEKVGTSGNTGLSYAPHLDFKFYDTADHFFGPDTARNPLCIYETSKLEGLKATDSADSCDKYGTPLDIGALRSSDQENFFHRECAQIRHEAEGSLEGFVTEKKVKVGEYKTPVSFSQPVGADFNPISEDGLYDDMVAWARDVWKNCKESPVSCINDKKKEFNDNPEKDFTILDQCEDKKLYYSVVEKFEECLNNERSGCTCELDMDKISDDGDYSIYFSEKGIRMKRGLNDERMYQTGVPASYYNSVPGDPGEPEDEFYIQLEDGETELESSFIDTDYPVLKWYKPSKDKLVMVQETGEKPACQDRKDTFLLCAETREKVPVYRDGESIMETLKVKFALQLRNELPKKIPSENVETVPLEESSDGLADKVKEKALDAGVQLLAGPLTPIIKQVIPDSRKSALQVLIDIPEDADISAFEVYCSVGTPVGDTGYGQVQGVVEVNNRFQEGKEGEKEEFFDVNTNRMVEGGEDLMPRACEYVHIANGEGEEVMRRKIQSVQQGGKTTFNINSCGGGAIKQLSGGLASYCYKLVPVDSQGNRNPDAAITECKSLKSLQDRVLEALGLSQVSDTYMKMAENAGDAVNAIKSGDPAGMWELAGKPGSGMLEEFENTGLGRAFEDDVVDDVVIDVGTSVAEGDYEAAVRKGVDAAKDEEVSNALSEVSGSPDTSPEVQSSLRESRRKDMDLEEKKKFVMEIVRKSNNFRDVPSQQVNDLLAEEMKSVASDVKKDAVAEAQKNNPSLEREVQEKKRENEVRDREANDLGLTEEQTNELYNSVLQGNFGEEVQNVALEKASEGVEEEVLDDIYRESSNIQIENGDAGMMEVFNEEIRNLEGTRASQALKEAASLSNEARNIVLEASSGDVKRVVYGELEKSAGDIVEEKTGERMNSFFNSASCAATPLENIQNNFGLD